MPVAAMKADFPAFPPAGAAAWEASEKVGTIRHGGQRLLTIPISPGIGDCIQIKRKPEEIPATKPADFQFAASWTNNGNTRRLLLNRQKLNAIGIIEKRRRE